VSSNSFFSTDALLKNMLNINDIGAYYEYKTWDNTNNVVTLYKGEYSHSYESIPFILIIKQLNYGKRDSLVLIRYLCYEYNLYKSPDSYKCVDIDLHDSDLLKEIVYDFNIAFNKEPVDYIIGTDADTILAYNCSDELIKSINKDKNIHGCVGYVDISFPKDKSKIIHWLHEHLSIVPAATPLSQLTWFHQKQNFYHKIMNSMMSYY
jgi:hypothetical protein